MEKKGAPLYSNHRFNLVVASYLRDFGFRWKLVSSSSLLEYVALNSAALLRDKNVFLYEKNVNILYLYSLLVSIGLRFQARFLRKAATIRGGVITVVRRDIPRTTA